LFYLHFASNVLSLHLQFASKDNTLYQYTQEWKKRKKYLSQLIWPE
jgi:hypothetical protein